ncbi:MAG: GGDEF domain-containing phosphodiesterase [Spirochaetaceae bacterium]|nr:GGDEF domain-containing phosphodiesterase [Spirochaetaceae bacterium]
MTSFIMTDGVTGLPSIVAYRESVLPSQPTLVAIVRLDNFSELSALFGYSFAENALKLAANRLSEVRLKLDGSAFRLRNNDFGFLKPLAEGELAEETAKTILQLLAGPYVLQEKTVELNYRIGCTVNLGGDTEKALNEASDALQKAKELGLDIQVHEEDPGHALSAEAAMADLVILSRNVTNKTLCLFYQPVISLATGNIAWNEALLRFRGNENEGEYLEPARLMKLANTTGHWTAIEDFVVESALVHASSPAGSVSINVGLRDFDRSAFLEKIEAGVQKANEHGSHVILEVLEGDFGRANEKRLEAIQALRSAGCLIAIDDFGIGYSNYSRLISFPVDIVKFDRSLVQTASSSDDVAILMEKLTNFCADNGALTVAEGIETEECAEFFSLMGVDFGQGFFWSKPIPEIQALPAGANDLRITKELFLERHSGNPHTLRRYP